MRPHPIQCLSTDPAILPTSSLAEILTCNQPTSIDANRAAAMDDQTRLSTTGTWTRRRRKQRAQPVRSALKEFAINYAQSHKH
jgi:hypothetical protein